MSKLQRFIMYCYIFIRNKLIYSVSFIHHLFAIFINKLFYLYKFSNKNKNSNKIFRPRYLRDRKWNEMKTKGLISRFFFTSSLNITRATSWHILYPSFCLWKDSFLSHLLCLSSQHFHPLYLFCRQPSLVPILTCLSIVEREFFRSCR